MFTLAKQTYILVYSKRIHEKNTTTWNILDVQMIDLQTKTCPILEIIYWYSWFFLKQNHSWQILLLESFSLSHFISSIRKTCIWYYTNLLVWTVICKTCIYDMKKNMNVILLWKHHIFPWINNDSKHHIEKHDIFPWINNDFKHQTSIFKS